MGVRIGRRSLVGLGLGALAACDSGGGGAVVDAAVVTDGRLVDARSIDGTPPPDARPRPDAAPDAQVPDAGPVWPAVVINEVDCRGQDWVELTGPAGAPLGDWQLNDGAAAEGNVQFHRLPADAVLDAAGRLVVGQKTRNAPGFAFGIACDERVVLSSPDGAARDEVTLPGGALPAGATFGRMPDGQGPFRATVPTRGAPNTAWVPADGQLFKPGIVTSIDLRLPPASREALEVDPAATVPAELTVGTPGGTWGPAPVGVRLKGRLGSFRSLDGKAGFKVDINFVESGQDLFGLRAIALNNAVQDPSFLHEWGAYRLLGAAGLPTLRAGHTWVQLDGEPYGLYVLVETWDDAVQHTFEGTDLLVEGLYGQDLFPEAIGDLDVDGGDPGALDQLAEVAAVLVNPPPEGAYAALVDRVAWDRVLGVMATELFIGHWDGYAWTRNNWFMHLNGDGVLDLLPWGVDQVFQDFLPLYEGQGLLLNRCLEAPACARRYDEALAGVLAALDGLDLPTELETVATGLAAYVAQDPRREFDEGTVVAFQQDIPRFLTERRAQVGDEVGCRLGPNPDPDGDGVACGRDCAPDDPTIAPGLQDICGDGIDQDCSGFADDAPDCPDCVERPAQGGGTWLICPNARTFEQGLAICQREGAEPVRIDNALVNRELHRLAMAVRPVEYWIGLDDRAEEGTFRWQDGTLPGFTAWADGEPNNSGEEDCAHFWAGEANWNDIPCEVGLGVLCMRGR